MIVDGVETDVSRFTGTRTRPGVVRFPLSLSVVKKNRGGFLLKFERLVYYTVLPVQFS